MAHRTKWYEERVRRFLENGGADGNGASTATEIIEYLRYNCGKRQLPSTGQTKVARGDSRRRGYMVSVWALINNPQLSELQKTYKPVKKGSSN